MIEDEIIGMKFATSKIDTSDEEQSVKELNNQRADEVKNDSVREILYSVLRGDWDKAGGVVSTWGEFYDEYPPYMSSEYYTDALLARTMADIQFFEAGQQKLWEQCHIDEIISIEQYLFNEVEGYAGQVDMVYADEDGDVVVADLKSSSGCYDKHMLQGAAYGKAVERSDDVPVDDVDRLEVHRVNPRTGKMVVHTGRDMAKYPVHVTDYWNDTYDELFHQFSSLAEAFEYDHEVNDG